MPSLVEIGSVVLEKKIFFNFVNVFSLFRNYLPFEKDGALHLNKLDFPSPKDALCKVWLKLAQWFWRRRFFLILSMYFRYFIIISPWRRVPLRDEIHNLRNFYETFMKIHDIFMTGSWLVHHDASWNFIHEYIHKM